MIRTGRTACLAGLLLGSLAAVAGCGDGRPARYPVTGTVAFSDGDPVRNASIELAPRKAGPSPRGRVDSEGHFVIGTYAAEDGAPAGEYRVVVVQTLPPAAAASLHKLGDDHSGHTEMKVVALRHASPDTTGVVATVEPVESNELEIVVEAR